MRIAVVGAGVSGCLVARLLASRHEVVLFEASDYPGGHANTVDVTIDRRQTAVDTGFMVFNHRNYPNFCRLLRLLEVPSQPSDMSFSVRDENTGLEYQGSSLNGLFAQRRNLARPKFLAMLGDILRFNKIAMAVLNSGGPSDDLSVEQFLASCRVGRQFRELYFLPMAAAIWSCSTDAIRSFPAKFMLGFFANHGLLQLRDRPQWRTIVGGARTYLEALLQPISYALRLRTRIASVARSSEAVEVLTVDGEEEMFDQIVFATHADQTLRMLTDASSNESEILGSFPYKSNNAVLHTDQRLLPERRRTWASWNYRVTGADSDLVSVTYDLRRLQRLPLPRPLLLTLNSTDNVASSSIIRSFNYHHPAYDVRSIAAQNRYSEIGGVRRTHYCGAYWGYGFHEDGVNSALRVAASFGIGLDECKVACMQAS